MEDVRKLNMQMKDSEKSDQEIAEMIYSQTE